MLECYRALRNLSEVWMGVENITHLKFLFHDPVILINNELSLSTNPAVGRPAVAKRYCQESCGSHT